MVLYSWRFNGSTSQFKEDFVRFFLQIETFLLVLRKRRIFRENWTPIIYALYDSEDKGEHVIGKTFSTKIPTSLGNT